LHSMDPKPIKKEIGWGMSYKYTTQKKTCVQYHWSPLTN
jgi:hypothetical protein